MLGAGFLVKLAENPHLTIHVVQSCGNRLIQVQPVNYGSSFGYRVIVSEGNNILIDRNEKDHTTIPPYLGINICEV